MDCYKNIMINVKKDECYRLVRYMISIWKFYLNWVGLFYSDKYLSSLKRGNYSNV